MPGLARIVYSTMPYTFSSVMLKLDMSDSVSPCQAFRA